MPLINSVGIVGGCGGFGQLFAAQLQADGRQVITIDKVPGADVTGDIHQQPQVLTDLLGELDMLLMCVPQAQALATLTVLNDVAEPLLDLLLVDICSVKTNICAAAEDQCSPSEYVSIHPMFGPDRGLAGNNLVFIPIRDGQRVAEFRGLLQSWALRLVDTDAASHDQVTSVVQVLAHATLVSFAQAEAAMEAEIDVPEELLQAMTTPIYQALSATAQGLLGENPALYHNIQTANPNGEAARRALQTAVADTIQVLGQADAQQVAALFARLRR